MKKSVLATALLAGVALAPLAALADNATGESQTVEAQMVTSRPRPEYDPQGMTVGAFLLYPALYGIETWDSNANALSNGGKSDFVTSIQPSVDLKSNWNVHSLNFHADSDVVHYARTSTQDFTNYDVSTSGRLDIYHDARIFGGAGYSVGHLPVYSPDTFSNQTHPTQYSDTSLNLAGEKEFDRLGFHLEDDFDRYNYANVNSSTLGFIPESLNNYDDNRLNLKTSYELTTGRSVYLLTGYDWRNYDHTVDISGYDRNSTGYTAALGANYNVSGVTAIDVYIGYREQYYRDGRLSSVKGPAAGAKLIWNATTLDTVTGSLTREIDETLYAGTSGYFATIEQLEEDHELLRNVILNGTLGHETDGFNGGNRDDEYWRAGLGGKYLLNQNVWVAGGYSYQLRGSSGASGGTVGTPFVDNQISIGINAHL